MNRCSFGLHRAVERARWLAELAAALDQANRLALELRDRRADPVMVKLADDIRKVRGDVGALQRGQQPAVGEMYPKWM